LTLSPDPDLIDTHELARLLSMSPVTLKRWRREGKGPPFIIVGDSVRYSRIALAAYLEANTTYPTQQ